MKIAYINFTIASDIVAYDYFWLSLKTYIDDNFEGQNKPIWLSPLTETKLTSIDDIALEILNKDPDILLMSLYVWNHSFSNDLAKIIKTKKPNITIVAGGPQIEPNKLEFWIENKHIDFICEPDGYGEVFFNEFLHEFQSTKNWKNVPYLRTRSLRSSVNFDKKSFNWPRNIYVKNKNYIKERKELSIKMRSKFYVIYETSRGCPYGCTYCEWGGGINSKVSFKPTEYILEDLKFLIENFNPDIIGFTDANFGIVERDIQIVEHLCTLKSQTGYPKSAMLFGPTKTKKENLYKIEELFAENKLITDHKISIQDFDPIINKNIKRTDAAWEEQITEYKKISKKYGNPIRLELILGLPGATLKEYYDSLDIMGNDSIFSKRYYWLLLPTSPASNPAYLEKYKIKTIKSRYGVRASSGMGSILKIGQCENIDGYTNCILLDEKYTKPSDIVVETYSYSKEEWLEMYMMDQIISILEIEKYTSTITKFLNDKHNINYSVFYKRLWDNVLSKSDFFDDIQKEMFNEYLTESKLKLNEKSNLSIDTFENSIFGVYGRFEPMMNILINVNRESFFNRINKFINDEFGLLEGIEDLCKWSCNMIKFIDYTPGVTKFESKYNWHEYLKTGNLEIGVFINKPLDKIFSVAKDVIDWHHMPIEERLKKYFLKICSENSPKMFTEMEISNA